MGVCTIGKLATIGERAKLAKETGNFSRNHIPELKLSDSGCVNNVSAKRQLNQLRGRGGVLAFLILLADAANPQSEPGLNCIEQRRLSNATLPNNNAFLFL